MDWSRYSPPVPKENRSCTQQMVVIRGVEGALVLWDVKTHFSSFAELGCDAGTMACGCVSVWKGCMCTVNDALAEHLIFIQCFGLLSCWKTFSPNSYSAPSLLWFKLISSQLIHHKHGNQVQLGREALYAREAHHIPLSLLFPAE